MSVPTFGPMASRPALVLDDPSLASEEVRVFANFPGRWAAGEPVAVAELGFDTDDDALAAAAELGLPLTETTVDASEGFLRLPDNHALNSDQLRVAERTGDEVLLEGAPEEELEPGDVLDQHAPDAVAAVAEVTDLDELDRLERAEEHGKGRSTVLNAIQDRRETLAAHHGEDG